MLKPLAVMTAAAVVVVGLAACSGVPPVSTIGEVDFETPLPIPALSEGTLDAAGTRHYDLTARAGETQLLPGSATETSGYTAGDAQTTYLGPTIVMNRGEPVQIDFDNALEEATTVHWHGMHVPPEADGNPHQLVEPGGSWAPEWTVDQPAGTLWYHPHPHGETEAQVAQGLAGMILIRDEAEGVLPLPRQYGVDDIPVIVQDARFGDGNQLRTDGRDFVGPLGDRLLVNGAIGPYLEVTTDVIRLRLLNASPARIYDFGFADGRSFDLIATDGGMLPAPVALDRILVSPGERAEILVRMSPGETVVLQSHKPDLGLKAVLADGNSGADEFDVLQLRAAASLATVGTVPATLVPFEAIDEAEAVAERTFKLDGTDINGHEMDSGRIDEVVRVDSTEIWAVTNAMSLPHSFHVHDVQFQVLSIDGAPPPPELAGWKDTVYLPPDASYRLIMRFEDYSSDTVPYMYHCHLLAHEDSGMMGQFLVVAPDSDVRAGMIEGETHGQH